MKATENRPAGLPGIALTVLRVLLGWHLMYEGIWKLATPGWSSATYLMESKWIFSGLFHKIIASPAALAVTDFMNIWGLILIGMGLFLGLFTRVASASGALILLLYYIANPPFVPSSMPGQGHFFIVNINIIEAGILLVFVFLKKDTLWSIDRLFRGILYRRKERKFPAEENPPPGTNQRRELLKNLASVPLLGIVFWGMAKRSGWISHEEQNLDRVDGISGASMMSLKTWDVSELKAKVPVGRIGHVEVSRLIPGGNLIAGFAHARDLIYVSDMIKGYFTDEKVIESLWLYEACGINTVIFRTDENTLRILDKYRKRGGKIQWIAQTYPKVDDYTNIKMAIDGGAVGAFVMGGIADQHVYEGHLEHLAGPIGFIRDQGLIAGTAGHAIQVPMACVQNGIETDFFMKTIHHDRYWSAGPPENRSEFMHDLDYNSLDRNQFHDNLWCAAPEKVTEFFQTCHTPWIGYKVLAAGAIPPEDGFKFAFSSGADFICVGMFDFQVIQNANILHELLGGGINRSRRWIG
jgi:uncharacterized membrane protein YphA (DoxX/SURF4 family)